jgi:hypothetical protein
VRPQGRKGLGREVNGAPGGFRLGRTKGEAVAVAVFEEGLCLDDGEDPGLKVDVLPAQPQQLPASGILINPYIHPWTEQVPAANVVIALCVLAYVLTRRSWRTAHESAPHHGLRLP